MPSSPKFFDISSIPPRGGWGVVIEGRTFEGNSEAEVVGKVEEWRRNNATFASRQQVESEVWQFYCDNDPRRCRINGGSPREMPSLVTQAKNAIDATVRIVKAVISGEPIVASTEEQSDRLAICLTCHRYDRIHGRCYECGCFVKTKTALEQEHCPLNRW